MTSPSPAGETFVARPLAPEQVDLAFPLLQIAGGAASVDHWRAFALAVVRQGSGPRPGIMTVQSAKGYVHAVFRHRVERRSEGCVLCVDDVVAADIFDRGLTEALADALERLAREGGCGAVDVALPAAGGLRAAVAEGLRRAGYAPREGTLRKRVAGDGAP